MVYFEIVKQDINKKEYIMTKSLPPEASWASPYLTVADVDRAVKFYQEAFNFRVKKLVPGEDGTSWHAEMTYKGQLLMCGKEGAHGSTCKSPRSSGVESPISLYLYCENVDDFYKRALEKGAKSLAEPENMFWGDRMCRLQGPDNYVWCFATYNQEGHPK